MRSPRPRGLRQAVFRRKGTNDRHRAASRSARDIAASGDRCSAMARSPSSSSLSPRSSSMACCFPVLTFGIARRQPQPAVLGHDRPADCGGGPERSVAAEAAGCRVPATRICRSIRSSRRSTGKSASPPASSSALSRLDYPAAKLDIKLVLEADDRETPDALRMPSRSPAMSRSSSRHKAATHQAARAQRRPASRTGPLSPSSTMRRTCPIRGSCVSPLPAFAQLPRNVACLQARLTIDNTDDTWLTRLFTIEYAALFDVFNPGLAEIGSPHSPRRHLEPFPHLRPARHSWLGCLERDGGCRSRHPPGAARLCGRRIFPPRPSRRRPARCEPGCGSGRDG